MVTVRCTAMTEEHALYRLLAWLSPGYPVGAYTYSHGLEQAVETELIGDAETAREWIADLMEFGSGFSDAVFLAHAHRAAVQGDLDRLTDVAELAAAFAGTKELALESHAQGRAFLDITEAAWDTDALALLRSAWAGPHAYPVAVGCAAAGHGIALEDTVSAYLHGFIANLVSAAVRLVPLGQTDGQRILAALEPCAADTGRRALDCPIDDVGTAALMGDICSMNHEIQHTRLFRS